MFSRIDLPLRPSTLCGLLAAAPWALLAILAFSLTTMGHWWLIPVPVLLLWAARGRWIQSGPLSAPESVIRVVTRGPRLFVELARGDEDEVVPTASSRVSGHYLVLGLQSVHRRRRYQLMLLAAPWGNAPAEPLRRLRVWLRLMPDPPRPEPRRWHLRLLHTVRSGEHSHDYRSPPPRPPSS